ncbi:serine hydrolase domain-containing protein [Streptosporangium sp. NPDC051023]|uniref:serine hydrolase domain-containing protein n=1 Tax=Streptosporangium sp. NPDC051023 TaxID=3155410 RepID=UPI00344EA71A
MSHIVSGRPTTRERRAAARCAALLATAAVFAASAAVSPATAAETSAPAGAGTSVSAGAAASPKYGRANLQRDVDAIRAIGISGVQARVSTSDGRQLVATSGVADLATKRPVPANGYFRIASTTKSFVATVVLQLVAEGRLSLDDTVESRLPGVVRGNGNDGNKITIRQLLQHTSGIHEGYPAYTSVEDFLKHRYDPFTDEQIVAKAVSQKPDFEPGKEWLYSNTGYVLLSMIIKKVTGNPWYEEVDERISRPLGLSRTIWSGDSLGVPNPHAKGYLLLPPDGPIDATRHFDGDAAGGLLSTTRDVNRFYLALLGGRLLPAEQLAEMQKTIPAPPWQDTWPGSRYGLGLSSRPLSCGGVYWQHGGDDYGYKTRMGVTADGRRSVTVSMTTQIGDERALRQEKAAGELVDRALCGTR